MGLHAALVSLAFYLRIDRVPALAYRCPMATKVTLRHLRDVGLSVYRNDVASGRRVSFPLEKVSAEIRGANSNFDISYLSLESLFE